MPKKGKITDETRLAQLKTAREKSLATRRKNKKIKELKKLEEQEKLRKYDEMLAKEKKVDFKEERVNTEEVDLNNPIEARAASTVSEEEKDPNVVNHPGQSRFGEKPMVETPIDIEEPVIMLEEPKPEPEPEPVKAPEPEPDTESEPDLFKSEEEYFSEKSVESEEELPPPPKRRKKKRKKKHIKRVRYYSSSDSSDSDDGEIVIRRRKPKKNVLYYEDLEEYLRMKNKETFVEPPTHQPEQEAPEDKEKDFFRQRLELAKQSLFSI